MATNILMRRVLRTDNQCAEKDALVDLFKATNGTNWLDQDGWLDVSDPCHWAGVGCSNGHVSTLCVPLEH